MIQAGGLGRDAVDAAFVKSFIVSALKLVIIYTAVLFPLDMFSIEFEREVFFSYVYEATAVVFFVHSALRYRGYFAGARVFYFRLFLIFALSAFVTALYMLFAGVFIVMLHLMM